MPLDEEELVWIRRGAGLPVEEIALDLAAERRVKGTQRDLPLESGMNNVPARVSTSFSRRRTASPMRMPVQ
jgi:hypothetical protein